MQDKHQIGKQRLKDILGDRADSIIESFTEVSPDFANYIVDFAYGELYAREGYADKYRELAAVACMIGQGNTGLPLKTHLKAMMNVGWTKQEVIETIIFLSGYAGFPSAVDALVMFKEILAEQNEV